MTWPLVVAVNYHRIGPVDPADPFHRLHTVGVDTFEAQIAALAARGTFVALDQLDDPAQLAPISFTVSFDDVPVAAHTGIDILEARGIPYTVAVCTQLAEVGHGIRDKVYFITHALGDDDIYAALHPDLGDLLRPEPSSPSTTGPRARRSHIARWKPGSSTRCCSASATP